MSQKGLPFPALKSDYSFSKIKHCPSCDKTVVAYEDGRIVNDIPFVFMICPLCFKCMERRNVRRGDGHLFEYWM